MSDQTQKIAEEARDKIRAFLNKPYVEGYDAVLGFIKDAIEKVDEKWRERFRKFEKIEDKFGPAIQRAEKGSALLKQRLEYAFNKLRWTVDDEPQSAESADEAKSAIKLVLDSLHRTAHASEQFRSTQIAAQASEQGAWPQQIQKYFKHCDVAFFLKMEAELELNQRKGNWRDWHPSRADLLSELRHHISKLVNAIDANLDTTESAADVANLCMKAATLAAHASEPWTPASVVEMVVRSDSYIPAKAAKIIANAHNATKSQTGKP